MIKNSLIQIVESKKGDDEISDESVIKPSLT